MSRPRSVIQISDQKYKDQSTKNLGIQAQNSALYSGQHLVESYMKTRQHIADESSAAISISGKQNLIEKKIKQREQILNDSILATRLQDQIMSQYL